MKAEDLFKMHVNNLDVGGGIGCKLVESSSGKWVTHDELVPAQRQFTCEPGMMRFTEEIFNSLTRCY